MGIKNTETALKKYSTILVVALITGIAPLVANAQATFTFNEKEFYLKNVTSDEKESVRHFFLLDENDNNFTKRIVIREFKQKKDSAQLVNEKKNIIAEVKKTKPEALINVYTAGDKVTKGIEQVSGTAEFHQYDLSKVMAEANALKVIEYSQREYISAEKQTTYEAFRDANMSQRAALWPQLNALKLPEKSIFSGVPLQYMPAQYPYGFKLNSKSVYDKELINATQSNIMALQEKVKKNNAEISPTFMYVLSIKLYETGHKDAAIFWFYAGLSRQLLVKDRVMRLSKQDNEQHLIPEDFEKKLETIMNGTAQCNIENYLRLFDEGVTWSSANIYAPVAQKIKQIDGDASAKVFEDIKNRSKAFLQKNREKFKDPAFLQQLKNERSQSRADERYCKKS